MQTTSNGKMTLKELCDLYLKYQHSRVLASNLTPKHYNDQIGSLNRLMSFLGQGCKIESISTLDLQNYKRKLQSAYTSEGHPWVTTVVKTKSNGEREYTSVNRITPTFSRLMKKVGIHAPKETGFYALRRTAATMAARSGDPFAVQRLLGHVDLTMATRYVQDVSEQTDRVIENSRKYVLQGEDIA